jgi:hypothetical protein
LLVLSGLAIRTSAKLQGLHSRALHRYPPAPSQPQLQLCDGQARCCQAQTRLLGTPSKTQSQAHHGASCQQGIKRAPGQYLYSSPEALLLKRIVVCTTLPTKPVTGPHLCVGRRLQQPQLVLHSWVIRPREARHIQFPLDAAAALSVHPVLPATAPVAPPAVAVLSLGVSCCCSLSLVLLVCGCVGCCRGCFCCFHESFVWWLLLQLQDGLRTARHNVYGTVQMALLSVWQHRAQFFFCSCMYRDKACA